MLGQTPEEAFANPDVERDVLTSWERFMSGTGAGGQVVRPAINDSWRRSRQSAVDYRRSQAPLPMNDERLHRLLDKRTRLVHAGASTMALARDYMLETGTVMVLTDVDGIVLRLEGDTRLALRNAVEKTHLLPGSNWSETTCGTNAIGTALETGQAIQVHATEHFCSGIQRWTCSASVIRDPIDGAVIGAIDISGLSDSYGRQALALAISAAARIEAQLLQMEMDARYRLLDQCFWMLPATDRHHTVLFDSAGRPFKANGEMAQIMRDLGAPRCQPDFPQLGTSDDRPWGTSRPAWIKEEWLRPVVYQGEHLGTVMVAPKPAANRTCLPLAREGSKAFVNVVHGNAKMHAVVETCRRVAASSAPILLLGETGVGKEIFAQGIHAVSPRRDRPFVVVNCGSVSRELLASELFGYVDGAFTGARRGGSAGKIEAASGGSLFLDEIGELQLDLQPMLLRALENGEINRIGETTTRKVDFRLVAATNRDLQIEVDERRFRKDLYYRLAVVPIIVPPLRERADDIPILVEHFVAQARTRYGISDCRFAPESIARLQGHDWPGNVRELRNLVESLMLTGRGEVIEVSDLPDLICRRELRTGGEQGLSLAESSERDLIAGTLRSLNGNVAATASALGLAKSTVYAKLRRYGIRPDLGSGAQAHACTESIQQSQLHKNS
ncbi:sigma-54-dependent Fis family transcriptional regulator [Bradyrhizobium sp. ISRA443]|uniref:sigma-54-dependent Fis family transcriptional regulator n=1 Tax=unclassified Bradyrhizobium TaxID=2631580 RepID=UPI00247A334D|nr:MULTISPECIES: sigma-54-dependent Fis family transcriptional regulator [unclassified Bradyrhizobium]WGR96542.1 sigma-54-dependent Fis family transcriptional regulator [Bradyrhizobium sp. ISRA436]WGS03429.1 sigma-54-dependent Fis family transcriptional regulator [Bradyrhizobium sp. ISRA437]WGS10313.1 sigma-54-dependent Fis family transcriptional regulator [Bradyrhizobium sp. ISRA443]